MAVIITGENGKDIEVTLEYERCIYCARVHERCGGYWYETHTSRWYELKEDAMKAYKRFVKKYIK